MPERYVEKDIIGRTALNDISEDGRVDDILASLPRFVEGTVEYNIVTGFIEP